MIYFTISTNRRSFSSNPTNRHSFLWATPIIAVPPFLTAIKMQKNVKREVRRIFATVKVITAIEAGVCKRCQNVYTLGSFIWNIKPNVKFLDESEICWYLWRISPREQTESYNLAPTVGCSLDYFFPLLPWFVKMVMALTQQSTILSLPVTTLQWEDF